MNCPEHLAFKIGSLYVWLYWHDVPRKMIPLRVWLSPLRYQINGRIFGWWVNVNENGRWHNRFMWWLKNLGTAK